MKRIPLPSFAFAVPFAFAFASMAPSLRAQPSSGNAFAPSVAGFVFDSTTNAPLVGAIVQIASINPSIAPHSDTTDVSGHFRIDGLTNGRYVVGFDHSSLGALGLESPLRSIEIKADSEYDINLAIPSGRAVRQLKCGTDSDANATGVLIGIVEDALNRAPLARATITVTWQAIVLDKGNLRTETQRTQDVAETDGSYAVCGLPLDAVLDVVVHSSDYRDVNGTVVVSEAELARSDFRLANVASLRGPGAIAGSVSDLSGKRIASGRAVIDALAIDVPVTDGKFAIRDLPTGTWKLDVRAIGYEPKSSFVEVVDSSSVLKTFVVGKRVQALETITVLGSKSRETTILQDVLRRHAASSGTIFMPGSPHLQAASRPSDVLRAARGFQGYLNPGGCSLDSMTVFLNGEIWPLGFASLDRIIAIRDVLAIEAYSNKLWTPQQWQREPTVIDPKRGCKTVVVWTRQP